MESLSRLQSRITVTRGVLSAYLLALPFVACSDPASSRADPEGTTGAAGVPSEEEFEPVVDATSRMFLDIESRVPGFGGMYIDGARLVALIIDLDRSDALREELASRRDRWGLSEIVVTQCDYAYSQLLEWSWVFYAFPGHPIVGRENPNGILVGIGVDEAKNRVHLGVTSPDLVPEIEAWATARGVPLKALLITRQSLGIIS